MPKGSAHNKNGMPSPVKKHSIPAQPLLCEKEVAHMLNCSVATIQRMRYQGAALKYYKINRQVKYSLEQVAEYLASVESKGGEDL